MKNILTGALLLGAAMFNATIFNSVATADDDDWFDLPTPTEELPPPATTWVTSPVASPTSSLPETLIEADGFLEDSNRLIQQMNEFRSGVVLRSSELHSKFDRLESLLRDHPACRANSPSSTPNPPTEPTPAEPQLPTEIPEVTPPKPDPVPEKSLVGTSPSVGDQESSVWHEQSNLDTIAVVNSAVNPLALANNLYAAGETRIALKMYQQIRQDSNEDEGWVIYQIAQCHRVLGSKANSDQAFRIVTAMPQSGRWGEYSKWWLANDDGLSTLAEQSQQLSVALETLRSQINESETQ